ncbi:MAG: O-antigen ligase family protein [Salibacteraceae bacterium]
MDNLYSLKNISPFISPPYIVGVLSPFLAIYAFIRIRETPGSSLDRIFKVWSLLVFLSTFCYLLFDPLKLTTIEFILKLTMPVYLYYFLRRMIRNKKDLHGILQAYVYSAIFVGALLLYEVLISPIRIEHSRGLERIQGNFADVTNYGFYINLTFLILAYFYFAKPLRNNSFKTLWPLGTAVLMSILCLSKINHVASLGVFLGMVSLFFLYNLKSNRTGLLVFFLIGATVAVVTYSEQIVNAIEPLIGTDLAVYKGEKESERLLHGRVGRWKYMFEEFSNLPIFSQVLGMPTSFENSYSYVSSGTHNDFMRILFFTGYVGFITFMGFLWTIYRQTRFMGLPQKFLVMGALTIFGMYAVSVNPTIYAPLLYILLSIFAYVALPQSKKYRSEVQPIASKPVLDALAKSTRLGDKEKLPPQTT